MLRKTTRNTHRKSIAKTSNLSLCVVRFMGQQMVYKKMDKYICYNGTAREVSRLGYNTQDEIVKIVNRLIKRCGTRNPYKVADELGVTEY